MSLTSLLHGAPHLSHNDMSHFTPIWLFFGYKSIGRLWLAKNPADDVRDLDQSETACIKSGYVMSHPYF